MRSEACLEELLVAVTELAFHLRLATERLDDLVAGVGLFDLRVELAGVLPLRHEVRLRPLGDQRGHQERGRDRQQRNQSEQRRDPDHHAEDAEHGQDAGDELAQCLLQAGRDVVDVVGDAAERLASGIVVEVLQRQAMHLGLDAAAQQQNSTLQRDVEDVALSPCQQCRHYVQCENPEQYRSDGTEIDSRTGRHVHARDEVGDGVVTGGPKAVDRLLFRLPRFEISADDSVEDEVGGMPEDGRRSDAEDDADDSQHEHEAQQKSFRREQTDDAFERALEVLGFRGRQCLRDAAALLLLQRGLGCGILGGVGVGHSAPATCRCESTISA
ncbi:unannotated protein [freshwater metagenome]|uniref:Unannotated protein n=1 Tax=freshwater metagenome TaxID=449393 RepID=A0A6J7FKN1_9ZZZZ